jgi:hypothetical protein
MRNIEIHKQTPLALLLDNCIFWDALTDCLLLSITSTLRLVQLETRNFGHHCQCTVKKCKIDFTLLIKQKSLHGRYFKELEQPEINIQASHAWLKKSNIHPETEGFIFAIQDRVINTRNYKKHICGLQSIIDKCRICGTEGETIEHIISSCTVLAQSEYKKRHDIFAKIIHMNLAVKFNLLKDTQPHYIYKPESCLENDNYKLYFDRTVLTDIHIQHNRPDIILNKQQKQAYLLDIAVPNSHNIIQTYNTKINKYLELSVAMRNLWCLEKISILPFITSATGIVPQSLFKNLKILDLENTLVVEIQKGILLYSCI